MAMACKQAKALDPLAELISVLPGSFVNQHLRTSTVPPYHVITTAFLPAKTLLLSVPIELAIQPLQQTIDDVNALPFDFSKARIKAALVLELATRVADPAAIAATYVRLAREADLPTSWSEAEPRWQRLYPSLGEFLAQRRTTLDAAFEALLSTPTAIAAKLQVHHLDKAFKMVTSRAFSRKLLLAGERMELQKSPKHDDGCLLPLLDMLNHHHDLVNVTWSNDGNRVQFYSSCSIEANSPVINTYGNKPNAELLVGYGFCLVDNVLDTVAFALQAPASRWAVLQTEEQFAKLFVTAESLNSERTRLRFEVRGSTFLLACSFVGLLQSPPKTGTTFEHCPWAAQAATARFFQAGLARVLQQSSFPDLCLEEGHADNFLHGQQRVAHLCLAQLRDLLQARVQVISSKLTVPPASQLSWPSVVQACAHPDFGQLVDDEALGENIDLYWVLVAMVEPKSTVAKQLFKVSTSVYTPELASTSDAVHAWKSEADQLFEDMQPLVDLIPVLKDEALFMSTLWAVHQTVSFTNENSRSLCHTALRAPKFTFPFDEDAWLPELEQLGLHLSVCDSMNLELATIMLPMSTIDAFT